MRRSWPQRLLLLVGLFVVGGCFAAAWSLAELDQTRQSIPRVSFDIGIASGLAEVAATGQPVNFLLVGADSTAGLAPDDPRNNERSEHTLTDTIIVLRVDPRTTRADLLSIPRDLWVDYASGGSGRINAAYAYGGAEELGATIQENLGIPVHRFIEVDFLGFTTLVDEIGGVPVYFEHPTRSVRSLFDVDAGCQVLSGDQALGYVRARTDYQELVDGSWQTTQGNDFDRIDRQQQFLTLVGRRAVDRVGRNPVRIRGLLEAIRNTGALTLDTNTSFSDLLDLASAFGEFDPTTLRTFNLGRGFVTNTNIGGADVLLLEEADAEPVLQIFRGLEGVLTPSDVTVTVAGAPDREIGVLTEKEFVVEPAPTPAGGLPADTTVQASLDQLDQAQLLMSWFVDTPRLELVDGEGTLTLLVGDDYTGLALLPRTDEAWQEEYNALVAAAADEAGELEGPASPVTTTTDAPEDTAPDDGAEPDPGDDATSTTEALLPGECPD